MFTGLVVAVGRVRGLQARGPSVRLVIDPGPWRHGAQRGDSIAVSGVCLTVADEPGAPAGELAFDVVAETLAKTTLGELAAGAAVNLEPSVTASTLMGGHLVQGHVDGVGVIERVQTGEDWRVVVRPPPAMLRWMAPKGSVTVDGVSLTLARVDAGAGLFEVALIPTTLEKTTLGQRRAGARVNLEADVIAKTVVNYLEHALPGLLAGGPRPAGGGPGPEPAPCA